MISGPREKLNWSLRYKIALGTAEGLRYLHEGCQRRIIHKDIKASNILLSEDFEPQVPLMPDKSDYGACIFQQLGFFLSLLWCSYAWNNVDLNLTPDI